MIFSPFSVRRRSLQNWGGKIWKLTTLSADKTKIKTFLSSQQPCIFILAFMITISDDERLRKIFPRPDSGKLARSKIRGKSENRFLLFLHMTEQSTSINQKLVCSSVHLLRARQGRKNKLILQIAKKATCNVSNPVHFRSESEILISFIRRLESLARPQTRRFEANWPFDKSLSANFLLGQRFTFHF